MFTVALPGYRAVSRRMAGPAYSARRWMQALLPYSGSLLRVFFFLFLYIWVRGTLPRFRYDQLMAFGWKFLLPLAIANIVVTSFFVAWMA